MSRIAATERVTRRERSSRISRSERGPSATRTSRGSCQAETAAATKTPIDNASVAFSEKS